MNRLSQKRFLEIRKLIQNWETEKNENFREFYMCGGHEMAAAEIHISDEELHRFIWQEISSFQPPLWKRILLLLLQPIHFLCSFTGIYWIKGWLSDWAWALSAYFRGKVLGQEKYLPKRYDGFLAFVDPWWRFEDEDLGNSPDWRINKFLWLWGMTTFLEDPKGNEELQEILQSHVSDEDVLDFDEMLRKTDLQGFRRI